MDLFTTAVGRDEILAEVRLPYLPRRSASAYVKHAVRHEGFAIAMVGVALTFDDGNVCTQARIGVGAAGPTPLRAASAEKYLTGKAVDEAVMTEAAVRAAQEADPPQDVHGSREYRLEVIKALTKSSLRLALHRAKHAREQVKIGREESTGGEGPRAAEGYNASERQRVHRGGRAEDAARQLPEGRTEPDRNPRGV